MKKIYLKPETTCVNVEMDSIMTTMSEAGVKMSNEGASYDAESRSSDWED